MNDVFGDTAEKDTKNTLKFLPFNLPLPMVAKIVFSMWNFKIYLTIEVQSP